ncbi:hypothetical protein [Acidovorax sp. Root217]|uniref:hypothetical protein n=1 Tax=Acidovorax sp. Root217 TaxID=1736492 RepID=UPI000A526220|nr:hypothetical protein [Acidovorax sp. Root217]
MSLVFGLVVAVSAHAQPSLPPLDAVQNLVSNDPFFNFLGTPINPVLPATVTGPVGCTFAAAQSIFPHYFRGPMQEIVSGSSYTLIYQPAYAQQYTQIQSMVYNHLPGNFIVRWSVGGETNFGSIKPWMEAAGC